MDKTIRSTHLKPICLIIAATIIIFALQLITNDHDWPSYGSFSFMKLQRSDLDNQKYLFKLAKSGRVNAVREAATFDQFKSMEMHVVPQLSCPTMVRVGGLGDGGKWICNPWRVPDGCVVYSLGINGDTAFEIALHKISGEKCKFYCVDQNAQYSSLFQPFDGVFLQAYISGRTDEKRNIISLADMMKKYNHTKVDILKIDIEGSEFETLRLFFRATKINAYETKVCQLMVEFHYTTGLLRKWMKTFELLEKKGFRMFSKEPNAYCPTCIEFSYLHLSCFKQYGLEEDSTYFTYFN